MDMVPGPIVTEGGTLMPGIDGLEAAVEDHVRNLRVRIFVTVHSHLA